MPCPIRSAPRASSADRTSSGPALSPAWGTLCNPAARRRGEVRGEGGPRRAGLGTAEAEADERAGWVVQRCVEGQLRPLGAVAAGDVVHPGELHAPPAGPCRPEVERARQLAGRDARPQVGDGRDGHLRVGGPLLRHVAGEPGDERDDVLRRSHERADHGVHLEKVGEVAELVEGAQLAGISWDSGRRVAGGELRHRGRRRRADEVDVQVRLDQSDEIVHRGASVFGGALDR